MNRITPLSELADFIGKSTLSTNDVAARRAAVGGMALRLGSRPLHRKATDMLGTVLALSARTRRMIQPRVGIDLDVFQPDGRRAIKISLGAPV